MRIYHTYFEAPLGSQTGWWDYRNVQPNQLCLHTYDTTSPTIYHALSPDLLYSHNLHIKRLRQQQHIAPYKLRICTKCNWQSAQDEEHVLLDCPSADLASLRVKHHHFFRNPSSSSNRLRDFISQADTKGLALFVQECLEYCACISELACLCWCPLQPRLDSAKLPLFGKYSYVT